jgi:hypothetical protein
MIEIKLKIEKNIFVREGVGGRGRNDPNIVCTYEKKKKENKICKSYLFLSFFLAVLEFELRALLLLGRCSTT